MTARKANPPNKNKADGTNDLGALIRDDTLAMLMQLASERCVSLDELIRKLIEGEAHGQARKAPDLTALTPKQALVLAHLKSGLSVKETANKMGVSEETVRTHILRARSRLDCSDLLSLRFQ